MLFIFGRDSRLEIEGAGVTGALGGAKNPHDIFINLDSAIQIGRRPHPSYFNVCDDDKNKMTSVLLTISGAVMNALAFIGTNFFFNKLMIMVKRNAKDIIWHLKNFRGPKTNGMKIE